MKRVFLAIVTFIIGAALGLYVGGWLLFIKPIITCCVAFDGGKGENYPLEIGSNTFIPGFEEQLIGLKAGDEKDIKVTFPEDYASEELKGQEAVFKIKVHVKLK